VRERPRPGGALDELLEHESDRRGGREEPERNERAAEATASLKGGHRERDHADRDADRDATAEVRAVGGDGRRVVVAGVTARPCERVGDEVSAEAADGRERKRHTPSDPPATHRPRHAMGFAFGTASDCGTAAWAAVVTAEESARDL
jgi:hypothetical protein